MRTDGGAFSVQSIDLAELNGNSVASVTFTGNLSGGGTVMQTFMLDGIAFGAETFVFSGFSNLVSMTWTQESPYHQFDNIVVSDIAAVPEPATLALFGLGLAGLGFARRRRGASIAQQKT